jgi:hypothetical protein
MAGAPVVDWLDYDTHYTERYLGMPDTDATAVQGGSLLTYAGDLSRPLLLVHGTSDDNVYFRHTLKLTDALFRAGKDFELLPLFRPHAHGARSGSNGTAVVANRRTFSKVFKKADRSQAVKNPPWPQPKSLAVVPREILNRNYSVNAKFARNPAHPALSPPESENHSPVFGHGTELGFRVAPRVSLLFRSME